MLGLKKCTSLVAGLVLAVWATGAQANYVEHGRVSFDAGGGLIKGAHDSDYSHAPINTLVLPGDTIWADDGSTMELEFSYGNFLRMADQSKLDVIALPPNLSFRGWQGSFYLQRLKQAEGDAVFETPACRIRIQKESMVRVDIVHSGATTVTVRWGRATVHTDVGSSVQVRTGQKLWVDPGYLPSEPISFNKHIEDVFDTWNRERAELLVGGSRTQPRSVSYSSNTIGHHSLNNYGDWLYVDGRYSWRPTVVNNYIPYRYGHWSTVHGVGDVWVGSYPFSYITTHYGRWHHSNVYGWVWSYHHDWSPAWCATVRYGDHFLWTPVDYYHRPVLAQGYTTFTIGGVRFSMYSTSCVNSSNLYYGSNYISPIQQQVLNSVNPYGTNINIWNINIGTKPQVNTPYDQVFTVRNYSPNRSIRGPQSSVTTGLRATDRVRTLETRSIKDGFSRVQRTGGTNQRTTVNRVAEEGRTRTVSISQDRPTFTRATRQSPIEASSVLRTRGSDSTARIPRNNSESNGTLNTRSTTRGSTSIRSSEGNVITRTTRGTTSTTTPGITRTPRGSTTTTSPGITRTGRSGVPSTPTVTRTGRSTDVRQTPSGNNSRITSTSRGESVRNVSPTPPRSTPAPSRSITRTPTTSRGGYTATPPRTTVTPRSSTPAPRTSVTPRSNPAPRMSVTPRTSVAPRSSTPAPSRSITRSTPSPTPRVSTPAPSRSITRSAPSSPAPSRSITRSAPSPTPRVSTPAPSRSITRSAPSAPAPSARPSSPSTSRSFSAPSRSSSSSSSGISRSSRSSR